MLREREGARRPGPARGLAAGLLAGLAADVKITYLLFALGIFWAARRSPRVAPSAATAAAVLLLLLPSYAFFGYPEFMALLGGHPGVTEQHVPNPAAGLPAPPAPHLLLTVAVLLCVIVMALALRRLPEAPSLPALRPVLALCLGWLFLWLYQMPGMKGRLSPR